MKKRKVRTTSSQAQVQAGIPVLAKKTICKKAAFVSGEAEKLFFFLSPQACGDCKRCNDWDFK